MTEDASRDRSWSDLLAAAQAGDSDAYRAFLTAATPFVRALARRRAAGKDAAEDVVQDVLLTVHRIRHTYEPGRPVEPWLAAITARRAIDALRRSDRSGARETHHPFAYETYADPAANENETLVETEALGRLVETLPPGQREALKLVKLNQMSLAEASAVSGQSVGSLKVNVHRAIKRLRLAIAKEEKGHDPATD